MSARASDPATIELLRRLAVLLDSAFRVPGTRIRFGLDALAGLVPGLGDLASPVFTGFLLVYAARMRLPLVVQARMVLNAAMDMVIGLVPLVGDATDVLWKANLRNLALLERHMRPGARPTSGDYAFVALCLVALAVIAALPLLLLGWLLSRVSVL